MRLFRVFLWLSLFTVFLSHGRAAELENDPKALEAHVTKLFKAEKWDELDRLIDRILLEKSTFQDGTSKLESIHYALDDKRILGKKPTDEQYVALERQIERWDRARPDSIMVPVMKIRFYVDYAWFARGGGWADSVTEEGWTLFSSRLNKAEKIFMKERQALGLRPYPCSLLYHVMLSVALGQDWDALKKHEFLVKPFVASHPEFTPFYYQYAYGLEPRWGGLPGDDYRFYGTLPQLIGGDLGKEIYAQVMLKKKLHKVTGYRRDLVDWDRLSEGLIMRIQRFPKDHELFKQAVQYSWKHGDTKEFLGRLEKQFPARTKHFLQNDSFGRGWARQLKSPQSSLEIMKYLKPGKLYKNTIIEDICLHPSTGGFALAVGGLGIYEVEKNIRVEDEVTRLKHDRYLGKVAYSPSGHYLLAVSSYDEHFKRKGTQLDIYSLKSGEYTLVKSIMMKAGFITDPVFTADSKKIIFCHNPQKPSKRPAETELFVWDWQKSNTKPVKFYGGEKGLQCRFLFIDDKAGSLICGSHQPLRFSLKDLSQAPTPFPDEVFPSGSVLLGFSEVPEKSVYVMLARTDRHITELAAIDQKTGSILTKHTMEEVHGDARALETIYDRRNNRILVISAELGGSFSTWHLDLEEGEVKFRYESTISGDGHYPKWLKAIKDDSGRIKIFQGTASGKIAVARLKQ